MRQILVVWHDRDDSRTTHEFGTAAEAEPWLRSVLEDIVTPEELAESGHTADGVGMLELYCEQGFDDVGNIEVYIDGVAADPAELYGWPAGGIPTPRTGRNPMDDRRWLPWTLRQELVQVLDGHYKAAEPGRFPPLLPSGVLSLLNEVGPAMGNECLPLIEAMLDDLYHRGIVARIPALSALHSPWYMSRESAELALRWGTPVILLPLMDGDRLTPDTPCPPVGATPSAGITSGRQAMSRSPKQSFISEIAGLLSSVSVRPEPGRTLVSQPLYDAIVEIEAEVTKARTDWHLVAALTGVKSYICTVEPGQTIGDPFWAEDRAEDEASVYGILDDLHFRAAMRANVMPSGMSLFDGTPDGIQVRHGGIDTSASPTSPTLRHVARERARIEACPAEH